MSGVKAKIESVKGQSGMAWFLQILFALQILMIVYVNYTKAYGLFDFDSALALRHGMEIWEHGLFLKDFAYYSTLEIDTVTFFGSLLYLVSGNLKLALAVSHLVGCMMIAALVLDICRNLSVSREQSLMALVMIFTPYAAGQLDWTNMIFICCGQYGFRIMALLFFFDLLLMCDRKPVRRKKILLLLIPYSLLVFWTALSAGNFVLCMIIFPVVCWVAVEIYLENRIRLRSERTAVVLSSILLSLLGWWIRSRNIGPTHRGNLPLVSVRAFFDNLHNAILGVFMLFGGTTSASDLPVFSVEGIITLIHFAVPCCCILAVWHAWHVRKNHSRFLRGVLIYSLVYIGILLLVNTWYVTSIFEYRYHLPWCVLLVMTAGILVMGEWSRESGWIRNTPAYGFLLLVVACNLWQGYWLMQKPEQISQFAHVIEQGKALDAKNVYFYQKDEHASVVRLFVPEWYCVAVNIGDEGMKANTDDFYIYYGDRTAAGDANMLVCGAGEFEALPNYIKSCYRQVDGEIYWSETNPWDGVSGLPGESADVSIDFPYSAGYFGSGELTDNGVLVGNPTENDDYLLRGPNTEPVPGTYNITLSYGIFQEGSQPSRLEVIVDDREMVAETDLPFGEETVTLEQVTVPEGERIEFRIWKPKDAIITVKQFTFERVR